MNNNLLNLQFFNIPKKILLPKKIHFHFWTYIVLSQFLKRKEITIRIVNKEEIKKINFIYRNKNYPTNIISFKLENNFNIQNYFIGDLIICYSLVQQEALKQNKSIMAHWAHLIIHGCLHLLGFDHINNYKFKKMQHLEIKFMLFFGYPNPY